MSGFVLIALALFLCSVWSYSRSARRGPQFEDTVWLLVLHAILSAWGTGVVLVTAIPLSLLLWPASRLATVLLWLSVALIAATWL